MTEHPAAPTPPTMRTMQQIHVAVAEKQPIAGLLSKLVTEARAAAREEVLDAHEAEYVDDGGDGYLACRCGYGHILGDDALVDHIHDARLDSLSTDTREDER